MNPQALSGLPASWQIIPTNGNKRPLGREWQKKPYTPNQLLSELKESGKVKVAGKYGNYQVCPEGIGLLCGDYSDHFLVAVDTDGFSAQRAIPEPLPETVSFTSGRPGRGQYLFKLPPGQYRNRRQSTAPGEALELRGNGCMSMLPPSKHPTTGEYRWIYSPQDIEVAIAPKWIAELMNLEMKEKTTTTKSFSPSKTIHKQPLELSPSISISEARLLLEVLPPSLADNYQSWLYVGMALNYVADELLSDWEQWSQSSHKYRPGECDYLWSRFVVNGGITHKTLFWFASGNNP